MSSQAAQFVHLHNHSEYSLLDGIAKVDDIVARLQGLNFDAYALTDHGVMYGAMEFYLKLTKANLKPIIGCEMYIAARTMQDKDPALDRRSRHLVLLAENLTGYQNLMQLVSLAHSEGYYYKPRVDAQAVMEHKAGLIALTACPGGVVAGPYNYEGAAAADEALTRWLRIFGEERLFLEVQNHGLEIEQNYLGWAREAAERHGVRMVATNDCHYATRQDARAHDIALCLRDKKQLSDTERLKYDGEEFYIKSSAEMAEAFKELPDALANTRVIADMCNLELDLEQVHFPAFTLPLSDVTPLSDWVAREPQLAGAEAEFGETTDLTRTCELLAKAPVTTELPSSAETEPVFEAYLRKLTYEGAAKRYGEVTEELRQRIEYELSVIIPKGFTTYFLVCYDFCRFAREHDIPVGPGRGSAAGSVVAYSLEITDLEPIKYDLYFERFLNPERIELPDFDIDFCMRDRDKVIEHVKRKYGADKVAQIITYSRLKARAVIKAVGRTKGLEFQYVDKVTKEIRGLNPTIDEAIAQSRELKQMIAREPVIAELIEDARRLEGIAAHHSVHAAGLVIGPSELWRYVPTQPQKDSDLLVTQYAMDTVPLTGLVKFDFLGLRNLTMIADTAKYIREIAGEEFDPRAIEDQDPDTYAMLQRGDNYGVFQFEAPQVKRMLIEAKPENLIDLAAINAANRPGPLQSGNTERYLEARKAGEDARTLYPSIDTIVKPTGGVLLFQEQVLEIARQLGGFTLGRADVLRKAMGKKLHDVMEKLHAEFISGAESRGVPQREAKEIWEMMEAFAGYGFNKAHSVCYSWISYQTAYLKCHYPHYYMSAMLNCYMGHADKLAEILAECRKMRLRVLPPSVNDGRFTFHPTKEGTIIFGLGGIKGIGENAVKAIEQERAEGGDFKSPAGFIRRMRGKGSNKKVLQGLIVAGAFDSLDVDRKEAIQNLDTIEDYLKGGQQTAALFGEFETDSDLGATPDKVVSELDVALLEKKAIGVFLTQHPYEDHPMYRDTRYMQLAELQDSVVNHPQHWADRPLPTQGLVGLLTDVTVRVANTSKKAYAKARLEDPLRNVAVLIWPRSYEQARGLVEENTPVVIKGRVQLPEIAEGGQEAWDGIELVVDAVLPYDPPQPGDLRPAGLKHEESGDSFAPLSFNPIKLELDLDRSNMDQLRELASVLEQTPGQQEVRMLLREVSGQLKQLRVNRRFYASQEALARLQADFPFVKPLN